MMKRKLNVDELKVKSFVTSIEGLNKLQLNGGVGYTRIFLCDLTEPSIRQLCPSRGPQCDTVSPNC